MFKNWDDDKKENSELAETDWDCTLAGQFSRLIVHDFFGAAHQTTPPPSMSTHHWHICWLLTIPLPSRKVVSYPSFVFCLTLIWLNSDNDIALMVIFVLMLEKVGWSLDDELGSDRSRWIQDLINQGLWFPSKSTTGWDGIHIWRGGSMNGIHLSRDVPTLLSGLQEVRKVGLNLTG